MKPTYTKVYGRQDPAKQLQREQVTIQPPAIAVDIQAGKRPAWFGLNVIEAPWLPADEGRIYEPSTGKVHKIKFTL